MKYIIALLASFFLFACGECENSKYYQVKSKDPINESSTMSHYEVIGIGSCASWQNRQVVQFNDSTSKFNVSQIVSRAVINKYE
ncbi:MAG: hypothetical protein HOP08_10605 [Cyclobacteriaceae bacterium]|nr:hypothetical protein [Cyclobacteriaceae bacterium]